MIASILELNRRDVKDLKIYDQYSVHKLVYSLFPADSRKFLYFDQSGNAYKHSILIISESSPLSPEHGAITSKIVPEGFFNYDLYAFQVRLNPVVSEAGKKNKIAIIGRSELQKWILEKARIWGFEVSETSLEISDIGVEEIQRGEQKITYNVAVFKGVLRVIDSTLFKESFCKGLGRGKAFGFGLLQIKPLFE